jgi:hypothetical protein
VLAGNKLLALPLFDEAWPKTFRGLKQGVSIAEYAPAW